MRTATIAMSTSEFHRTCSMIDSRSCGIFW
jgi:hypothetical protein